jgi:hypothetical protein
MTRRPLLTLRQRLLEELWQLSWLFAQLDRKDGLDAFEPEPKKP